MILESDSDQKILNPSFSDEYLKSIKIKGDNMSNLREKLEKIIKDSVRYREEWASDYTNINANPSLRIVEEGEFINNKVDQIIEIIEQELATLFKEVE